MEKLSIKEIANIVNGKYTYLEDVYVKDVSINSLKVKKDDLFIAIKGEKFDGHDFIKDAYNNGAICCICQRSIPGMKNMIIVEDTRVALMHLAKFYRRLFGAFIVGVTGSVGKTSTKEMIYAVLSYNDKTLKTKGNLNNEIGLPLTLMGLSYTDQFAVIEMGMSGFNEISVLSTITAPNVALITNIGVSHLEELGSRENILKAKLEIVDGLSSDAPLILNADDDLLCNVSSYIERPVIYIGIDSYADIMAKNIKYIDFYTEFDITFFGKTIHARIPTLGKHNVYNALFAFAVGITADLSPENIVKAFMIFENAAMRQEITQNKGILYIKDCYNASPDSMRASLNVLIDLKVNGKKFAVLGDMLELGEQSENMHFDIGRMVGMSNIDVLVCFGNMARHYKRGAITVGMRNVVYYNDYFDASQYLFNNLKVDDAVLFKASRGVHLEEVIRLLLEQTD